MLKNAHKQHTPAPPSHPHFHVWPSQLLQQRNRTSQRQHQTPHTNTHHVPRSRPTSINRTTRRRRPATRPTGGRRTARGAHTRRQRRALGARQGRHRRRAAGGRGRLCVGEGGGGAVDFGGAAVLRYLRLDGGLFGVVGAVGVAGWWLR